MTTYYANQIKEKENAVILSCDELTKDLFDNDLGEKHDEMALRIWNYFKRKSVELVNIGCTVILDWGFWSLENRRSLTEFCHSQTYMLITGNLLLVVLYNNSIFFLMYTKHLFHL